MKFIAVLATIAAVSAIKVRNTGNHAADLIQENGDDIDTSLAVQLDAKIAEEPNVEQFQALAQKLDIELTPELLGLGSNEAISNALIEVALGAGKSQADIEAAMGGA